MISRRILVGLAAGAALGWPLAAQAQQRGGMRRLGVLIGARESGPEGQARAAALVEGLGALGWREGANLRIDWRWTNGNPALYDRYAAELVSLNPEVLMAAGSLAVEVLRRQTSAIPIVFVHVTDPVGQGFVASLARPGGANTGFSIYDPPMVGKWLEMLTQINPPVGRVAMLFNPETTPYAGLYLRAIEEAAASLALAVWTAPCHDDAGIEAMMARLASEKRGGFVLLPNAFADLHRDAIVALAVRHRVPAVYPDTLFTAAGGLMSYGIAVSDLFRRAAVYVDRILKGAKPADLPVQNPTRFTLVLNQKTAAALGITFAPSLLAGADEIVE